MNSPLAMFGRFISSVIIGFVLIMVTNGDYYWLNSAIFVTWGVLLLLSLVIGTVGYSAQIKRKLDDSNSEDVPESSEKVST